MRRCCASCFGDRRLSAVIQRKHEVNSRQNEDQTGTCGYCGSAGAPLVNPVELRDLFELVLGIYTEHDGDGGQDLVAWLMQDWALFTHDRMDSAHAKELLADILDDGEVVRRPFVVSPNYRSDSVRVWKEFRDELMRHNRFFPRMTPDTDSLGTWLPTLLADAKAIDPLFYRARLQEGTKPFEASEMGAPPIGKASHGRANPTGIPYLYLASDPSTAVSEIRPHTGERASVAAFKIDKGLKIVDLRDPRGTVSPFLFEDELQIGQLRKSLDFLAFLGEELTRPVLPSAAHIDYLPSQYLCEFVKHCGNDGVLYSSSVGEGFNLALFEPERAQVQQVVEYHVHRVAVQIAEQSLPLAGG